MLTCNLMGGLGNQLFQIFTTISLALKTSNNFVFSDAIVIDGGYRHTYWEKLLFKLKPFLRTIITKQNDIFVKGTIKSILHFS